MSSRVRPLVLAALASLAIAIPSRAFARDIDIPRLLGHVRTTDLHIRAVIGDGLDRSSLFRDLVVQLDASDVIVYVESDRMMPERLLGRLTFMSAAGGQRYLMVRIRCALTEPEQIAMIGHELQHAIEIANAASVVDATSLAAEYRRIGFASGMLRKGAGYDTQAAIDTGRRVWMELAGRAE